MIKQMSWVCIRALSFTSCVSLGGFLTTLQNWLSARASLVFLLLRQFCIQFHHARPCYLGPHHHPSLQELLWCLLADIGEQNSSSAIGLVQVHSCLTLPECWSMTFQRWLALSFVNECATHGPFHSLPLTLLTSFLRISSPSSSWLLLFLLG